MTAPLITHADLPRLRKSRAWRNLALATVKAEPMCWLRLPGVCTGRSTTGDHVIPASHAPALFLDPRNIRGACKPCNDYRRDTPVHELPAMRAHLLEHPPGKGAAATPARAAQFARRHVASTGRRPSAAAADYFGTSPISGPRPAGTSAPAGPHPQPAPPATMRESRTRTTQSTRTTRAKSHVPQRDSSARRVSFLEGGTAPGTVAVVISPAKFDSKRVATQRISRNARARKSLRTNGFRA